MTERDNEKLWERIKKRITAGDKGGNPGQWSARKAQMAVLEYKKEGGGYKGNKKEDNSLVEWTKQDWRTKSGKPSLETGERYLPKKSIEHLSSAEYSRTSRLKREAMKEGEQFSKQPASIAKKVRLYRM
jgi:hypothetical protein